MLRRADAAVRLKTAIGYLRGMAVEASILLALMAVGLLIAWLSQRP